MVEIKFKRLDERAIPPTLANDGDAGFDIRALERCVLAPGSVTMIHTGLAVEIPYGYELQVRSKSGLTFKEHISVAQGVGTIDSGYRGEVCVLVKNGDNFTKVINAGSFVAQLVPNEVPQITLVEVDELSDSQRGAKGFGSTKETDKPAKTAKMKEKKVEK